MKRTPLRKVSRAKLPTLKRKLWAIFALFIKERDKWTCFTCGNQVRGYAANAGHFIPKGSAGLALYFHEDNVHCQCSTCNLVLEGNHYEYGKRLGENKVQELYQLRNTIVKWDAQDYLNKIEEYEIKYRALLDAKR